MTTGVVVPFWLDRPALEAVDVAVNADRHGFDELWMGEMLHFDAFALGSALARATERIHLVIGPLAVGLRDPASLALGIASVATLGQRPADLALGASTPAVVANWHGRPWRQTVARIQETVAALRPLLAGERSDYRGRQVSTQGFRLALGPQQTRIVVAAFGERMLRAAVASADRIVFNLLTPELLARLRDRVERLARELDKAPPPLAIWVPAALDPTPAAFDQLARQLVLYMAPPGYGEMFTRAGFGHVVQLARGGAHPREVLAAIPGELIESIGAVGDLATVRARIGAFHAAGAEAVALVPVTADDPGGERLLGALNDKGEF